ncbi:MAG: pantoate--beta-alanine ligase [Desulfovibrio sp.]|jgi:pantoate--beta-alanine ligase|nr:pantoate--beta-alanine ligase [Desulfovibrio sp.]
MKTAGLAEASATASAWKRESLSVGLVPTMGWLHQGHLSLIRRARRENARVIVSIFVNPIQFGPNEDLDRYPRDLERDAALCREAGVDMLFHPTAEEMYPEGFQSSISVGALTQTLCGRSRPAHFTGVCTVVGKLFNLLRPERAYFGQKDAQQATVIRRMAADLNMNIGIVVCPTVREEDGLAVSSRNVHLGAAERQAALCLFRALSSAQEQVAAGVRDTAVLLGGMRAIIASEPAAAADYIEIVDPETLFPVDHIEKKVLAALAVFIGKTRLIDNVLLEQ